MKRSEIVKEIEEYLLELMKCGDTKNLNFDASFLLGLLEAKGILPPGYMKPIEFYEGKQYPLVPGDFQNEQGIWCTPGINEWEPETDEKK